MSSCKTLITLSLLAGLSAPVLADTVEQVLLEKKLSGAYEQAPDTTPVYSRSAECDAAAIITSGDVVSGTTTGFPNLVQSAGPDVFYRLLSPGGLMTLSLCEGTNYDSYLYLYDGCPNDGGMLVAWSDDECGMASSITRPLDIGTYWLVVTGFGFSEGSYTLTVEGAPPVPCDFTCTDTITSTSASIYGVVPQGEALWYCMEGDPGLNQISTCNEVTNFDTILELWYSGSIGCVNLAADDDDACENNGLLTTLGDSDSPFAMEPGLDYYIKVYGWGYGGGTFRLDLNGGDLVDAQEQPLAFSLGQAVPNPFNPSTTIAFSVAETAAASLTVYDLAGHAVATLVDGMVEAGSHSVVFDGSQLASGVYFYTLQSGASAQSQKMVLVK